MKLYTKYKNTCHGVGIKSHSFQVKLNIKKMNKITNNKGNTTFDSEISKNPKVRLNNDTISNCSNGENINYNLI